jgi:5-methylcytosine-specific restriction endonuclease McrA
MESILPIDKNISIRELSQVFKSTAATYKFYWFLSILHFFDKENKKRIEVKDILIQMIVFAWYPVNYFKLSFGYSDNLHTNIKKLREKLALPVDISAQELFTKLKNNEDREINQLITHFSLNVPYRFLSPWIQFNRNRETIQKSQAFQNNCIYSISDDTKSIEINPLWFDYLTFNTVILKDYTYWNLTQFIQAKNPNSPNISNKLIKPIERESLTKQRNFWKMVFDELGTIECIYTRNQLINKDYDMEHFIPWSFVTHNQLWNLVPADSSINLLKSNKLPKLDDYLKSYVTIQREAIRIVNNKKPSNKLLEDYLVLGPDIQTILNYSESKMIDSFRNILAPLIQIAYNSGFQYWER